MFNEGHGRIGSAKAEIVKPWFDTLKEIEQQISSKLNHQQNNNDDNRGGDGGDSGGSGSSGGTHGKL